MKILRYVLMAVLILGVSGAAHAFTWTLNDPPPPPLSGFIPITQTGVPILFDFVNCSFMSGAITYKGCAEFQNQTNDTLTNFQFTFEDPTDVLGGATPNCTSDSFSVVTCSLVGGDNYVIAFNCNPGTVCGIVPQGVFNVYEDAVDGSMFPNVTVVPNATPEPGSIWLALSGMGSLGYLVRRRRRTSNR
jgi:uncharacterized protein (TIGR03382 family)